MRTRHLVLSLVSFLPLAPACSGASEPTTNPHANLVEPGLVAARLGSLELRAAEEVAVVFINDSTTDLRFNACSRRVDRRVDGVWVTYPEELRDCPANLMALPANGSVATTTDVPIDALPGEHRFRFAMQQAAAPASVSHVLATFTVR